MQNGSAPGHFVVLTCFLIINRGNFGRALKGGHWIPLAPYQHSRGNFGRALINFLCIFSGFNNCGIYLVTSPACTFAHPFVTHHVCVFLSRHMSRAIQFLFILIDIPKISRIFVDFHAFPKLEFIMGREFSARETRRRDRPPGLRAGS